MPFAGPVVADILTDTATLVEPLVYTGRDQTFTVPAGYVTDFATVPQFVTWLVPRMGAYTRAAILHDWLCSRLDEAGRSGRRKFLVEGRPVTARQVDGIFRRVMRESGTPVVRRWLMWAAVRWAALGDPARRPGWLLDAPAVVGITVAALPVVLPVSVVALGGFAVYSAAEDLATKLGRKRTPPSAT
jgi:Protein of unknown function (DUF1353)